MNKEDYDEEEEEEEGAGTAEGVLIAPPVFKDDDETEVRQNGLVSVEFFASFNPV